MPDRPLRDQVAVVAGATRGAGRGIARMLGAAGATVYCTGRSVRNRPATPGRPETLEETAELVAAEGGRGIAVRTDHTIESEVDQLFARVRAEAGRLDVLVNDIWGGDALTNATPGSSSRSPTATRLATAATSSTTWRRTRSSGSPTRWPPTSTPTA